MNFLKANLYNIVNCYIYPHSVSDNSPVLIGSHSKTNVKQCWVLDFQREVWSAITQLPAEQQHGAELVGACQTRQGFIVCAVNANGNVMFEYHFR